MFRAYLRKLGAPARIGQFGTGHCSITPVEPAKKICIANRSG